MFKWLKDKLMKKKDVSQQTSKQENFNSRKVNDMSNKTKFEIELYEEITDDNGMVKGHKKVISEQPIIIEAANKAELDEQAKIFHDCGQKMKIVRVIEQPNQNTQTNTTNTQTQNTQSTTTTNTQNNEIVSRPTECVIPKTLPIKYYTIGDIEVKDDNGKIYQKQWVRLTSNEAKNIRLVNETTNKIINTTGKCFEMKKWVLIETTPSEDDISLDQD